jgi:ubiquinone/menaquinone biosynthesis C-methylase UbiE
MSAGERDLTAAPIRSRIEAALLDAADEHLDRRIREHKHEVIGAMVGTVVELGPGTGANLRFYGDDVRVIGFEPNTNLHERLAARAVEHGVEFEIRTAPAEQLDLPDASVDAVVSTLVLCGVNDTAQVLAEVRRVLRPGGTFFFFDHVRAPEGTLTRRVQSIVKHPHRWMFQGCEVDRDTEALIRSAGFARVEVDALDTGAGSFYVRHQIIGTALR